MGQFEPALALADGATEGAFLMSEEFRFQEVVGQGRAVEFEEGAIGAGGVVMDGVGDDLFAGTGFPPDQDRGVPFRHLPDQFQYPIHGLGVAHDVLEPVVLANGLLELVPFQGDVLLLPLHAAEQLGALGDERGHHFQESAPFPQPLGAGGLGGEHAEALVFAGMDGRADEGQFRVVLMELAGELGFVAQALDDDGAAFIQDRAHDPFAGQVAHPIPHRAAAGAEGTDGVDIAVRFPERNHAGADTGPMVQDLHDLPQLVLERQGAVQGSAHLVKGVQLMFDERRPFEHYGKPRGVRLSGELRTGDGYGNHRNTPDRS